MAVISISTRNEKQSLDYSELLFSSEQIQIKSLSALPRLLRSGDEMVSFQGAGGMEKLIESLKSSSSVVRRAATNSICLLAENEIGARMLYDAG